MSGAELDITVSIDAQGSVGLCRPEDEQAQRFAEACSAICQLLHWSLPEKPPTCAFCGNVRGPLVTNGAVSICAHCVVQCVGELTPYLTKGVMDFFREGDAGEKP